MKKRNYIKEKKRVELETNVEETLSMRTLHKSNSKKTVLTIAILLIGLPIIMTTLVKNTFKTISLGEESAIQIVSAPSAVTASQKGVISVPSGIVKANPFVPYRNIDGVGKVNDVPAYDLVEPPEMLNENSDAARVMDTIVSGILYDKFSPSAILNIEGNDYLVKKGDVVNNYKVVSIMQDSVTVQLGSNVYKAGIGEILTEGSLNHNDVSNLSNKFGGEK